MSAKLRKRLRLNPELEQCIAMAKSLAAAEAVCSRLDSYHVIIAAVQCAPSAAQMALEKAGHSWDAAQKCCPQIDKKVPDEIALRPMRLVENLSEVIYGTIAGDTKTGNEVTISTERCLSLILQNPSIRLRDFLRRIGGYAARGNIQVSATSAQSYDSFREYLAARREVWVLRRIASYELHGTSDYRKKHREGQLSHNACERLLNQLVRIEEQTTCRAAASSEAVMAIRHTASHYELSELQSELMEGLFIHDLYGIPNTPNMPLSVGDLAQMMAPETYPNNCLDVAEAIGYLIKQDLLELFDSATTIPTLRFRVGLGPAIMKELLTHLATDIVNDTDLKAAKRRLSFSRSWPV